MHPFFHNYKMAVEVVTSVHLVKKKIQAEISLSRLVHPRMQRYVNEMKLLEIIRIGFLPGKVGTTCLQLMVCSNLPKKLDLFYKQKYFTPWNIIKYCKVVCTCMCDGSDSCSGKTKTKKGCESLPCCLCCVAALTEWICPVCFSALEASVHYGMVSEFTASGC